MKTILAELLWPIYRHLTIRVGNLHMDAQIFFGRWARIKTPSGGVHWVRYYDVLVG